jgi:hypothetical protein
MSEQIVRAFTYSRYHGKGQVGSTRLRVHQLMKYWPEYKEYKYGEKVDVMIYQKVYMTYDWRFMEHFEGIQILDICDPDWLEFQNVKQTIDQMDGVTCPTEAMAEFLRQLTDKPVKVIPDRHDLELVPSLKKHTGKLKSAVWFGYAQNAELLRMVVPVLEREGISLTVISNDNPYVARWASEKFDYNFLKFDEETINRDLQAYDICILPQGNRPQDRFKSNNKTIIAQLAGLPVVTDIEGLMAMQTPQARNKEALACYNIGRELYDVKLSVKDMQELIGGLVSDK